jgi:uncharacterized membrane protein
LPGKTQGMPWSASSNSIPLRAFAHGLTTIAVTVGAAGAVWYVVQAATGEHEAWDSGAFWPAMLLLSLGLGAVLCRTGTFRERFAIGAMQAIGVLASAKAFSTDDEEADFFLVSVFFSPIMAFVLGATVFLGSVGANAVRARMSPTTR